MQQLIPDIGNAIEWVTEPYSYSRVQKFYSLNQPVLSP
jgi:hypothetical protein